MVPIFNSYQTVPASPDYHSHPYISVNVTGEINSILEVNCTVQAPNDTLLLDNVNLTNVYGDIWNSSTFDVNVEGSYNISCVARDVTDNKVQKTWNFTISLGQITVLTQSGYNNYTYTLETIIQAGQKNMAITSVPIRTNEDLRPSRLLSSIPNYIKKSVVTIVRISVVYKSFQFFMTIAAILFGLGFLLGLRFLYFYFTGDGSGHMQSVVLAGVLMGMGFQTGLIAFVADLQSVNRKLLEEIKIGKHL